MAFQPRRPGAPVDIAAPEVSAFCLRDETKLFLVALTSVVEEALNSGVRIIVDVEPGLYESALAVVSSVASCVQAWKEILALKDNETGATLNVVFKVAYGSAYGTSPGARGPNVIEVIIDRERKRDELMDIVSDIITSQRRVYMIITPRAPEVAFSVALQKRNVVADAVAKVLLALDAKYGKEDQSFRRKLKYVGRVPHEMVLYSSPEAVEYVAANWAPPPPSGATYLQKKQRDLEDLVLPQEFKELLAEFVEVARAKGRGSLMLVGLTGSGRKTVAASLAATLGVPAYYISIANILSRWVGESEANLKAFFESLRAKGGLVVVDNVETLFAKSGNESVSFNLRSILMAEMARNDNNFVAVFTASEGAPKRVLSSPILGELKLVMPVPTLQMRQKLARMFVREIIGDKWDKVVEAFKAKGATDPKKAVYGLYADLIASATAGMTPGEIYRVAELVVIPSVARVLETGDPGDVAKRVASYTARDVSARTAQLRQLAELAKSLGVKTVADNIDAVMREMTKMEHEEKKLRGELFGDELI